MNTNVVNTSAGEKLILYSSILGFIAILIGVFYLASSDSSQNISTIVLYSSIIIVPLLIVTFLISINRNVYGIPTYYNYIGAILGFFAISILIYFFLTTKIGNILSIANTANLLITLILIVALAIGFYYFGSYLKTASGISRQTRFYIYLLFYIPCLFIDFAKYITDELRITSKPVYILFVLEAIFVLLYFYLPKLVNKITNQDSITLLPNVAWLDRKTELANSDLLVMKDVNNPSSKEDIFRKNYAISMWIFLNNEPSNYSAYNKESNIFNYGNGMPRITYMNNVEKYDKTLDEMEIMKDKIVVYLSNNKKHEGVTLTIEKQKWNNLVLNYNSSSVDIFINGHLEKTVDISKEMPIYSSHDIVTIGENKGLYGALCNILYHKNPLSELMIANSYNLFMNKNPPTNNL